MLTLSLLGVTLSVGACAATPLESSRVVAIGDVHGGYDALLRVLEGAGISDASGHWIGGTATLVQVGDLIDRGSDDRMVLELIMRLEQEADRSGGRVISLLGNHEVMNLHGDLRYVSRESFASFADDDWQERVDAAYAEQAKLGWQGETASVVSRQRFDEEHPKGYLEHANAFAPSGAIGAWLRRRQAVVQLGSVVFLHGGISPDLPVRGLKQLNDQIKRELQVFDAARDYLVRRRMILPSANLDQILAAARAELNSDVRISAQDRRHLDLLAAYASWLVSHPNGPLWFRGLALWPDVEAEKQIPALLASYGASHFVIGHTPQLSGGIRSRTGGSVFLIDSGMLNAPFYPGGVEQALEIVDGRFSVLDTRGRRSPVPPLPPIVASGHENRPESEAVGSQLLSPLLQAGVDSVREVLALVELLREQLPERDALALRPAGSLPELGTHEGLWAVEEPLVDEDADGESGRLASGQQSLH